MGSVLIEQYSLSQLGKVIFKKKSYEALLTSDIQENCLLQRNRRRSWPPDSTYA